MYMHSYKLIFLYICFAMLHTTLHNETFVENLGVTIKNMTKSKNYHFLRAFHKYQFHSRQLDKEQDIIFDMIIPEHSLDVELWPKVGNTVTINYALHPSLPVTQRRHVTAALRAVEDSSCVRFRNQESTCLVDGGGDGEGLCFASSNRRTSYLGRRSDGKPQSVTLADGDGSFWSLHLLGHSLGLPHPYSCGNSRPAVRVQQQFLESTWGWRAACTQPDCWWATFDPASALQLTADELSSEPPLPSLQFSPAAAQLVVSRARRQARFSHQDLRAINEAHRCAAGCHSNRLCSNGGFMNQHCTCTCPAGFSGDGCGTKLSGPPPAQPECHRYLEKDAELSVAGLGFLANPAPSSVDFCVMRVQTSLERPWLSMTLVRLENARKLSLKQVASVFHEVILCTMKLYVFHNDSFSKVFCILDYVGENLSFNVSGTGVDILLHLESFDNYARELVVKANFVVRLTENPFHNLSSNGTAPAPRMRAVVGKVEDKNMVILLFVIFTLMMLNYVLIALFRKYWEHKYGTAIQNSDQDEDESSEDEQEPDNFSTNIHYLNTNSVARRFSTRSDTKQFRTTFFSPRSQVQVRQGKEAEASVQTKMKNSFLETSTTQIIPPTSRKRVSFSDQTGPLGHPNPTLSSQSQVDYSKKSITVAEIENAGMQALVENPTQVTNSDSSSENSNGDDRISLLFLCIHKLRKLFLRNPKV